MAHREQKINFVRFADDFIVTGKSKEILEEVKTIIREFLKVRGLELSEEKTLITNINDGFDFLGWNFKKYNGKLLIKPSNKSVKKISQKLSNEIKENRAISAENLINKLNAIITGWGNYHQPVCSKETFKKLDNKVYEMLWKWAKRKHSNKGKRWIANKYWRNIKGRNWQFSTKNKMLKKFSDIPIVRHTMVANSKNPYLEPNYYQNRKEKQREKRLRAYKRTAAYKLLVDNDL